MKFSHLVCVCVTALAITSCETRTVKYDGLNDLAVGVHQVVLYENGEFYLELGLGGTEGTYTLRHDTVYLNYFHKPESWPNQLLMTKEYFITINKDDSQQPIKISR